MKGVKKELLLRKDDYELLVNYLRGSIGVRTFDKNNAEELALELKRAKLVSNEEFPDDAVGINSLVTIKEERAGKEMDVMLVKPDKADIKEKKISIMSPIGTALIGFRKGSTVKWKVPSGLKTFLIVNVINQKEIYAGV